LDKALKERRSIWTLKNDSLTLEVVSQLLWATQGITDDKGHRTAGSAFEAYPLEVYVLVGNITNLTAGVYHYEPQNQSLAQLSQGDVRAEFANTSVVPENAWIKTAPAIFFDVLFCYRILPRNSMVDPIGRPRKHPFHPAEYIIQRHTILHEGS
jgi:hypothetical protein